MTAWAPSPIAGVDLRAAGPEHQAPGQADHGDQGVAGRQRPGGRVSGRDAEQGARSCSTASTTMPVSSDGGQRRARSARRQAFSPCGSRAKNAMTATEVSASSSRMPNPPVVPSQKNRSGHRRSSRRPRRRTIATRPVALWASDAALGMLLPPVRPSAAGQHVLAAERVHVPPHAVVERQRGGEQRGQEQQLGGLGQDAAAEAEQQPRSLLRGGGRDHVRRAGVRRPWPSSPPRRRRRSRRARGRWRAGWCGGRSALPRRAPGPARSRRTRAPRRRPAPRTVPTPAEVRSAGDRVAKLRCPPGRAGQPGDGLGEDDRDLRASAARRAPGR